MKLIAFDKYEGAGNDFIMLDFFAGETIDLSDEVLMRQLCDRHFGIGADGIIALSPEAGYDFRMKYLNSDGRFSTFCGNGSRCISLFAQRKWNRDHFKFIASDGVHESEVLPNGQIRVRMKDINSMIQSGQGWLVDSGSPHLICEVDNPFEYPVVEEGRKLRSGFSAEGANVNFIQVDTQGVLRIATYERGVESETLACGTGIVASAYYWAITKGLLGTVSVPVISRGGHLSVRMTINSTGTASEVWLKGPARKVFSGFYEI
ncbi:MAG: diaminopimelate epimerase [Saprospiraceae bacterium]